MFYEHPSFFGSYERLLLSVEMGGATMSKITPMIVYFVVIMLIAIVILAIFEMVAELI